MKGLPYLRKKGDRFVIERKVDGKTQYIKTLPNVRELLVMLGMNASQYYEDPTNEKDSKASDSAKRLEELEDLDDKSSETFL